MNRLKIEVDPSAAGSPTRRMIRSLTLNGAALNDVVEVSEEYHPLGRKVTLTFLAHDFEMTFVEPEQ